MSNAQAKSIAPFHLSGSNTQSPERTTLVIFLWEIFVKGYFASFCFLIFILFGLCQLILGYLGIEHHLGLFWGLLAIICATMFRFTLPITIGVFFGVTDVLEWHWIFGLLIALPSLIFMAPAIVIDITEAIHSAMRGKHRDHSRGED